MSILANLQKTSARAYPDRYQETCGNGAADGFLGAPVQCSHFFHS